MTRADKRQLERIALWNILQHGYGRAGRTIHIFLIGVILLSAALIPLEFVEQTAAARTVIRVLEGCIVGLFTVEYLLRLYSAPRRLQYMFSFFGIVDLLSILPFYAGVFGSPLVRLVLLVRLFKLGEMEAAAQTTEASRTRKDIGLIEGEQVEYVVTKSPVALALGLITPLIALVFGLGVLLLGEGTAAIAAACGLLLFSVIFLWKTWLDFSYDVIYVTNYRLIFQNQHLLGRSINQVSYNAITNVKPYYPTALSYVLRFGSLVIDTAAEHPGQMKLHMVRQHEKAAHHIMQKTFVAQQSTGSTGV